MTWRRTNSQIKGIISNMTVRVYFLFRILTCSIHSSLYADARLLISALQVNLSSSPIGNDIADIAPWQDGLLSCFSRLLIVVNYMDWSKWLAVICSSNDRNEIRTYTGGHFSTVSESGRRHNYSTFDGLQRESRPVLAKSTHYSWQIGQADLSS